MEAARASSTPMCPNASPCLVVATRPFAMPRTRHLTVEILAPNQRPVQVTQDLASFWQHTSPELKKALQKRYPTHEWR